MGGSCPVSSFRCRYNPKVFPRPFRWQIIFYSATPFSQTRCRQPPTALYCYGEFSDELYYLVPTVLIFTAKTRHATNTLPNHSHSLYTPLPRWDINYTQATVSHEPLPCGIESKDSTSLITTFLTCSSLGLTVIFRTLVHKLYLLIYNLLPLVASRSSTGWTSL